MRWETRGRTKHRWRWRGCNEGRDSSGNRTASQRARVPAQLLLEQRLERLPRVVRRLRLPRLVGGEILHDLRLEHPALVARMFVRHTRRDVLPAFPQRGGVEEAAVAARVKISSALQAGLILCRHLETDAQLSAPVALERLGAEPSGSAPARRAFHTLALRLGPRRLRALPASGRIRTGAAAVLISAMFVFAIVTQCGYLMKT